MPYRPIELDSSTKVLSKSALVKSTPTQPRQHGEPCILLDLPTESLTHITSFLDLPSLLILSRVNKSLYRHIEDDNTWYRAFVHQFFGVSPESDVYHPNNLLLRRSETTWRNEFIFRYTLARRWERSRNGAVTHTPCNSPISSIHPMPSHTLLTSYLESGLVSRSSSLTGKVHRGFFDASGTTIGLGNPDLDLAPDVSVCTLSSHGGTARILWGFWTGQVAVTTANRGMEARGLIGARFVRCKVEDQHDGAVLDAIWGKESGGKDMTTVVTGGTDGRVKLWDAEQLTCLWTSDLIPGLLVPDPCLKIALGKGIIAAAMSSGDIILYVGLSSLLSRDNSTPTVHEIRLPSPIHGDWLHVFTSLYIDHTPSAITLLVSYENSPFFYRLQLDISTRAIEVSHFGDVTSGSITALLPCFTHTEGESSFVIVGDQTGGVSIYDWHSPSESLSVRKFEANTDGSSVTALAWNGVVLAVGSARGMVGVWHALTFERLREFVASRKGMNVEEDGGVKQILLGPEKDMLVAAIGPRIMAWQAEGARRERGWAKKRSPDVKKAKKEKMAAAKYHRIRELQDTICQSHRELEEEHKRLQRVDAREREQRLQLESLGMNEAEAVEYLLMVTREEAELERHGAVGTLISDEGNSEDDVNRPTIHPPPRSSSVSPSYDSKQNAVSVASLSPSNQNIQMSPPFGLKAMAADASSDTPNMRAVSISDISHFPPMTAGSSSHSPRTGTSGSELRGSWSRTSKQP